MPKKCVLTILRCLSVIRRCIRIIARMWSIGFFGMVMEFDLDLKEGGLVGIAGQGYK